MTQIRQNTVLAAIIALLFAWPVWAHHSILAEFDLYQQITISGTITRVDWINPHIQIYVSTKEANGDGAPWRIESWSTGLYHHMGISKGKLAIGTPVTISVYRAKD